MRFYWFEWIWHSVAPHDVWIFVLICPENVVFFYFHMPISETRFVLELRHSLDFVWIITQTRKLCEMILFFWTMVYTEVTKKSYITFLSGLKLDFWRVLVLNDDSLERFIQQIRIFIRKSNDRLWAINKWTSRRYGWHFLINIDRDKEQHQTIHGKIFSN